MACAGSRRGVSGGKIDVGRCRLASGNGTREAKERGARGADDARDRTARGRVARARNRKRGERRARAFARAIQITRPRWREASRATRLPKDEDLTIWKPRLHDSSPACDVGDARASANTSGRARDDRACAHKTRARGTRGRSRVARRGVRPALRATRRLLFRPRETRSGDSRDRDGRASASGALVIIWPRVFSSRRRISRRRAQPIARAARDGGRERRVDARADEAVEPSRERCAARARA
jgi:hypothetical protein